MPAPLLKRKNTVGITCVKGQLREEHFEPIIEGALYLREDDICGIGDRGNRFLLKIKSEAKYNFICENFTRRRIVITPDLEIEVTDISTYRHRVIVKDIPFEVNFETLKKIFSLYGEVDKVQMQYNYRLRNSKYRKIRSDRAVIWMDLHENIPCSFYIKQTQTYIYMQHENQVRTCNKCGKTGHYVKDCKTKPDDRANLIDLEYFLENENENDEIESIKSNETNSELDGEKSNEVIEEVGEKSNEVIGEVGEKSNDVMEGVGNPRENPISQGGRSFECVPCGYVCDKESLFNEHMETHKNMNTKSVDIHLDPTQEVKEYTCDTCEYTCNYESIMNSHMETHMEEKDKENSFACSECENKYHLEEDLTCHIENTHKEENTEKSLECVEKPFECTECDYRFTTEVELNIHKKNHTDELLIDTSYSEVVKTPTNVFKSTPKKRLSFDKLAAHSSQPCNSSSENSTGKNKRGASLSPSEYKNTQNEGLKKSKLKKPVEKVN